MNATNISPNHCFSIAVLLFCLIACQHPRIESQADPYAGEFIINDTCSSDSIYFQEQILPILVAGCATAGCHDPGTAEDDITLISYETLKEQSNLVRENTNRSRLYRVLVSTDTNEIMPPPPLNPLDSLQIALIGDWINQGGNNNSCDLACDTTDFPTFSGTISRIIQNACLGCHNEVEPDGGIDYSTFEGIQATIDDGSFWASIIHESGYSPMPKFIKLAECEIRLIKKWLEAGAQND